MMNKWIRQLCFLIVLTILTRGALSSAQYATDPDSMSEEEPEIPPEFASKSSNVSVALGREAILDCPIRNLGRYRVGWMRADDQTILTLHTRVVTHSTRVSINHDQNTHSWRLHIRGIKASDEGCYMCQINYRVMMKHLACIDVLVPPKIIDEETSGDIEVPEGGNITLQCRAKGNPTPRISWKRDDSRPIKLKRGRDNNANENITGEVLTLKRMDRRQSGAIFCIASNDIPPAVSKRMLIHVTFKPRVTVPILSYGSPLEADVTLECNIEAYPFAINYWKFKPSTKQEHVLTNGSKYILTETRTGYEVNLTVIIRNLSRPDLGEYKCYSSNGLGESESGFVKIHETQRATVPPTTRVITTTTTRSTTPRPPPVVTITTRRIAQLFTTRVPLVEFAENAILGDPIASKGRKTKSSSYQSLDINTSISSYFKPTNSRTLYTITIIYTLYLRLRDCY